MITRGHKFLADFLDDKRISRHMTVGIDNPVYGFNDRLTSHRSSWAHMLKAQMKHLGFYQVEVITDKKADWDKYDIIVVDWGMEFQGVFNVFGGASDDLAESLERVPTYKGFLFSAHIEPPSLGDFIDARHHTGTERFQSLNSNDFRTRQTNQYWFEHVFESDKVIFGDSHALSCYRPGYMIFRHDGKTLYGILKDGLSDAIPKNTKDLLLYFGNIDVRHHLLRPDGYPIEKLMDLLEQDLLKWQENSDRTVEIVELLPIEHEERKLPKTGYYEGTPFYGSREERSELVEYFNQRLGMFSLRHGWKVQKWPEAWRTMEPSHYADLYMERPRSVHLGRQSYPYDFDTNELRKNDE